MTRQLINALPGLRDNVSPKERKALRRADQKRAKSNFARFLREGKGDAESQREHMAELYALWLAQRDGIVIPDYTKVVFERDLPEGLPWSRANFRFKTVRFGTVIRVSNSHGSGRRRRHWTTETFEETVRIDIPNWDHVPTMVESNDAIDQVESLIAAGRTVPAYVAADAYA